MYKNFKLLASFFLLIVGLFVFAPSQALATNTQTTVSGWNAYVHLPDDYGTTGSQTYPAIVFIPGLGEIGTNASALLTWGPSAYIQQGWDGNVVVDGTTHKFIVISIQPPTAYPRPWGTGVKSKIDALMSTYRIDPNRLNLTGLSMGGWAVSQFATYKPTAGDYSYLDRVASVINVQGVKPDDTYDATPAYPGKFTDYASRGGKFVGFEQTQDFRDIATIVNTMNAAAPGSATFISTSYGGGGHCCFNQTYGGGGVNPPSYTINGVSQTIYQWMARQSRGGTPPPPTNQSPTANAGIDQTITLPTSSVTLSGSGTDSDGSIASYAWTKVSGSGTITSTSSASTSVTGLTAGTSVFQLTVTDNQGATGTDTMNVVVNAAQANQAPIVNAGVDQTITLPTSSATVTATATDPESNSMTYAWTKVSGGTATITSPTTLSTTITGLSQGVYTFWLTATDSLGASNADAIMITVNAAAGGGGTVTITNLVNKYTLDTANIQWGTTTAEIRDSVGVIHGDAISMSSANGGVAGKIAQAITLPSSGYVSLGQSLPVLPNQNYTVSLWAKFSTTIGTYTLIGKGDNTPSARAMQIFLFNGLIQANVGGVATNTNAVAPSVGVWQHIALVNSNSSGTFKYTLYVDGVATTLNAASGTSVASGLDVLLGARRATSNSDITGQFTGGSLDDVRIYDKALTSTEIQAIFNLNDNSGGGGGVANVSPTANAGVDQTITLPTSSVTLSGSGTDPDGTIAFYAWTKVSGSGTITSPSSASTTITGLTAGNSVFQLTVTDNLGVTGTDTMNVVVNPAVVTSGAKKIVILGSSTAYGTGASPISSSWVNLFTNYILAANSQSQVINLAVPSQNTYHIMPTGSTTPTAWPVDTARNITQAISRNPDAIIINLPSNDAAANLSVATQQANWNIITTAATSAGIPLYVTTTQPRGTLSTTERATLLVPMRDWIISTYGARSIDFWTTIANPDNTVNSTYDFGDQIHVNNLGHALFSNRVISNTNLTSLLGTTSSNIAPTANAGIDQAITTSSSSVTLSGSGTDYDGTIASYTWTKISGSGTITNPSSASTTITGLTQGSSVFRLTVVDNLGATGFDNMNVVVNAIGSKTVVITTTATGEIYRLDLSSFNILPGDTIAIPAGIYSGGITLGGFYGTLANPITIINQGGQVQTQYLRINNAEHFKLSGSGSADQYGIKVIGFSGSGVAIGVRTSDYEVERIEVTNVDAGFLFKVNPSSSNPLTVYPNYVTRNIKIHDNYIHAVGGECMYIGHTYPTADPYSGNLTPIRMDNVKIHDNTVDGCGWDGIQLSNARDNAEIYNNTVRNSGTLDIGSQQAGIILGGNTNGKIYNNVIENARGNALELFGYGDIQAYGNTIKNAPTSLTQGMQDTVYFNDNSGVGNIEINPSQRIYFTNNVVTTSTTPTQRHGVVNAGYNGTTLPGSISDNTFCDHSGKTANQLIWSNIVGDVITGNILNGPLCTSGITNLFPVANAGLDQTITLPASSVTFTGSGTDSDGTIASYAWSKISGGTANFSSTTIASPTVSGLGIGSYTFRLTVIDDMGDIGYDDVVVLVNAPAFTVSAGTNQTITLPTSSITLSGIVSGGATAATYLWAKTAGGSANIVSPASAITTINSLSQGIYDFQLTVTDTLGRILSDTVRITVNQAPNQSPTANAGSDQTITLPTSSVTLSGSGTDSDGTITLYSWSKVSGTGGTINSPSSASTTITGLTQGSYTFRLTVTDNDGATGVDNVIITVNPATVVNLPPVVNAGADQTITLSQSSVSLSGTASDPNADTMTYAWSKFSGGTATITNPTSLSTTITALLAQGTYIFRLTVTDSNGSTTSDDVVITVNIGISTNQPPVVDAGVDKTITGATVQLVGTASDPDGNDLSYRWAQVFGPKASTVASPNTLTTSVSKLAVGTYTFSLSVTDTLNATTTDLVSILVQKSGGAGGGGGGGGPHASPITNGANASTKTTFPALTLQTTSSTTTVNVAILNVRSSPVTGAIITTLSKNSAVTVLQTSGLWSQVSLSNSSTGWVYNPYLSASTTTNTPSINSTSSIVIPVTGVYRTSSTQDKQNLQNLLNQILGSKIVPLEIDGKWGPKTTAAIILYQKNNGLKPDGTFGKMSATKANQLLGH